MTSSIKKNTYITDELNTFDVCNKHLDKVNLKLFGWAPTPKEIELYRHTLDYENINSKFDILQHASNSTDIHFWNKQCLLAANLASLEPHHRKPRESSTVGSKIGRPRCPLISPSSFLSPSLPHSPPPPPPKLATWRRPRSHARRPLPLLIKIRRETQLRLRIPEGSGSFWGTPRTAAGARPGAGRGCMHE